ncbi:MAG TPA: carbon-nitrogen family hydrolase [Candidatus Dormibacteraeota bacterium]|nr:carbon-nitrogen family hydrolase [Candidatus Dormibacteraeota bacterium]
MGLQFDIAWENKHANYDKVRSLLKEAKPAKDSLVALPEMFATGFSMNAELIAESYGGDTEQFLATTAKEYGIYLIAGAAMRSRAGQARNKALVFSPSGELVAFYAKMRPFTPGGEGTHYVAGQKPVLFKWQKCVVSPFICYDIRFPELFRAAAVMGQPHLFIVVANFPEKRIQHWVTLLQARAIENQAYVLGVNRVGTDPYYTYCGRSILVTPQGEIVADAGSTEGWIRGELDLANVEKYRAGLPFLSELTSSEPGRLFAL